MSRCVTPSPEAKLQALSVSTSAHADVTASLAKTAAPTRGRCSSWAKLGVVCLLAGGVLSGSRAHAQTAPATNVGSSSATQTVTVTITTAGTTNATLGTAIQVLTQGLTGYDFAYVSGGTCAVGTAYAVNATCTVEFIFTPRAPGMRLGAVELFTTSGTAPIGLAYINGIGNGPLPGFMPGTISTIAGGGTVTFTGSGTCPGGTTTNTDTVGDGCLAVNTTTPADNSKLSALFVAIADPAGNIYISDNAGSRIRKITAATGIITTVAGTGTAGSTGDGGAATSAQLNGSSGLALDGAGNLYIGDSNNERVQKITAATGIITTVAGTTGTSCATPTASPACGDTGAATSATLHQPYGLAVDTVGNLYIADGNDHRVRKVTLATGIITTVAGTGTNGYTASQDGGLATSATLDYPFQVVLDTSGNFYIADGLNARIRKVTGTTITTVAGGGTATFTAGSTCPGSSYTATDTMGDGCPAVNATIADSAKIGNAYGMALDSAGNIYISDVTNNVIHEVTAATGIMTLVAGTGTAGYVAAQDGGPATSAEIDNPFDISLDGAGNLYIAENTGGRIRKVTVGAPSLAFASTTVSTSTAQQVETLVDNGNTSLTLSGLSLLSTANFNLTGAATTCTSTTTLASGATCGLGVIFAPVTSGALTGSVNLTDNANPTTQSISLTGTGTVGSTAQTITFPQPTTPVAYGASPVTLTASSTSGLTILYTVTSGPATVSGSTLTFTGVGTVVVAANQGGNATYATAATVSRVIAVTAPATAVASISSTLTATLTITTAGTTNGTLGTAIQVLTQGVTGLDFAYVSGGTCAVGTAYTVGQTCTVEFNFTPAAPGVRLGAIELFAASGTAPIAVAYISGIGNAPLAGYTPGTISTVAGNGTVGYVAGQDGGAATSAELNYPFGAAVDAAGNLYIADQSNNRIRKVTAATGNITTVAGNGTSGYNGDNVAATSAKLYAPAGVAVDGAGNLYIADQNNQRIRKVTVATGIITTVAGNGTYCSTSSTTGCLDGGAATSAELWAPNDVAVDGAGNFYIADYGTNRIRKVMAATGIITTVAGTGSGGYVAAQDGNAATSAKLNSPNGIAVDGAGNFYIADYSNNRIRKVTAATGIITTVAGNNTQGYVAAQDGGAATSASLQNPLSVALDGAGNLYIADTDNNLIRKVTAATGIITTVAGNNMQGYVAAQDGGAATSAELSVPTKVAVDGAGNLYIVDDVNNRIRKVTASANPITFATSTYVGNTDTTDGAFTLTLTNNGNTTLTFPTPGAGTDPSIAAGFTIGGGSTCPQLTSISSPGTLASGTSCTDLISFAPVAAGSVNGSMVTTDSNLNVTPSTQSVSLSGTALAQTAQTISFTQPITPDTAGNVVTLVATGGGSGNPVTFSVTSGPGTVSGTNNSTLTYTGAGTVIIAADQAGSTTYSAAATVTETVTVNAAAGSYTAPSTAVGSTSAIQTATINITAAGTPGTISVLTQGATGLDFVVAAGGTCSTSTAYTLGQVCTVKYTFAPKHPGLRMGGITLTSSGGTLLGNSYISGTGTGPQVIYSPATELTNLGAGIALPTGVAIDGNGNVYVAAYNNNAVKEIPAGCTTSGCVTTIGGGFNHMQGVAVDGSGNVFVADYNNNAVKEVPPGCTTSACVRTLGSGFNGPDGIAVDGSGNVYVGDYHNNAVKEIIAVAGVIPASSPTINTLGSGFSGPIGVAVDANGNVYVANYGNSLVQEMIAVSGSIPASSPTINTLGSGFYNPYGVAVDVNGNVYVTDYNNSQVKQMVAVGGSVPASSPTINVLGSGFYEPYGIAVDGSGNLYIGDEGYGSVIKLDYADAPTLTFASTNAGSSSAQQVVSIGNNGNATLTLTARASSTNYNLTGAGTTCTSSSTVAANASCGLGVIFAPTALGTLTGTASVTGNALNVAGTVQSIALTGTGAAIAPSISTVSAVSASYASTTGVTVTATESGSAGVLTGGVVTFGVAGGVGGSFSPTTCTLIAAGTCTTTYTPSGTLAAGTYAADITASFAATGNYTSASGASTLTVTQLAQTITFTAPATPVSYGTAPVTLIASGGGSGNPVVFSIVSGPGSVSGTNGSTLTYTGPGTIVVAANQAGAANYTAAPQATQTVVVNQVSYVVDSTTDPSSGTASQCYTGHTAGTCTLRDAVTAINALTGATTTVTFDSTVFATQQTITLTHGVLTLSGNNAMTFTGPGQNLLTVSGNNASGIFFQSAGSALTITNMTISNGHSGNYGGCIGTNPTFYPTMTLTNVTVSTCYTSNGYGGAVFSYGTTNITNSTITGGTSSNYAGGIYSLNDLTITGSTISNNTASAGHGGGALTNNSATVTITNSTFSGNSATGVGGGYQSNGGTLNITGSTFTNNTAATGGAINGSPTTTLSNSTFTGNTTTGSTSAALQISGGLTMNNNTIYGNTGNGVSAASTPSGTDNIIAGSTLANCINSGCPTALSNLTSGTFYFMPLGNYGGPTQTMPQLPGSAGYRNESTSTLSTDQRGVTRATTGANSSDAGAVQSSYAATWTTQPPSSTAAATNFTAGVTLTENSLALSFGSAQTISLPVTLTGTGTLTGSPLTSLSTTGVASGTFQVSAVGTGDTLTALGTASSSFNITGATPTTSTVSAVSAPYVSTTGITVTATESGSAGVVTGGVVTFGTAGGVGGSFSPATCTLTSGGTCTTSYIPSGTLTAGSYTADITASFATVGNYTSASGTSTLTITQLAQTITFNNPGTEAYGTTPTLTATGGASGNAVTFTSATTGICTITTGGALTFVTVGTCTINADQTGNTNYIAATQVQQSFTVSQASQTISFTAPVTPATAGTSATLVATGGASGNPVTFSVTSGPGTVSGTNGSTLTYTGSGTVIVAANQASSTNYAAATTVSKTVTVNAAASSYTAPTTNVGATSATQTAFVNITTAGTLGTISVLMQGASGLDYANVSGGTCAPSTAYTLGQVCTVQYSFTPKAPGQRLGAIVLTSSTPVVLGTSYISGMGTGALAGFTPGTISTVAGGGTYSFTGSGACPAGGGTETDIVGDGCLAVNPITADSAKLSNPQGVAVDGAGNQYIADYSNRIRKVTAATGVITTVAGTGASGFSGDGGAGTSAQLSNPAGVTVDGAGNLYIADASNNRIRKVTAATGIITTVVGGGSATFANGSACPGTPADTATNTVGDGCPAINATIADSAKLYTPFGVAVDGAGNLYIVDTNNFRIRKVTAATGIITTVVGTGTAGYILAQDGGAATSAELNGPDGVTVDGAGNLYIVDQGSIIRKVTAATGIITTVAGNINGTVCSTGSTDSVGDGCTATTAALSPNAVAVDGAGNLYIADTGNNLIRKVTAATQIITTVAGNGTAAFLGDGGAATSAELQYPTSIAVDGAGNLYIADQSNDRIREVTAAAATLTYSSTNDGSLSAAQSVTVTNNGNAVLTASSTGLIVSSSFTQAVGSGTPADCTATFSLASGATCNISIKFEPVGPASGSTGGTIVLTDNNAATIGLFAGNSTSPTQTINLTGTAALAIPSVSTVSAVSAPYASTTGITVTATESGTQGAVSGGVVTFGTAGGVGGSFSPTTCTLSSGGTCTTSYIPSGTLAGGTYTADITASFAAVGNYTSASGTNTLTITPISQTISFTTPTSPVTYGVSPITLVATGGGSGNAVTFSITSGGSFGTLSGTNNSRLTVTGAGSITIAADQAGNASYNAATQVPQTIVINKAVLTVTAASPTIAFGATVPTYTAAIAGYVYTDTSSVVSGAASLTTTPTTPSNVGTYTITVAIGSLAATNYSFTFTNGTLTISAPVIVFTPTTVPAATVAAAYSQSITASGGTSPYAYSISAGTLPVGVTLNAGSGLLSGTPTASGSFSFTIKATDSTSGTGPYNGTQSYTFVAGSATVVVAPSAVAAGTVAAAYTQSITASGGTATYAYTITSGSLPAGITLSSAGLLSGTPTAGGSFNFTVTATDSSTGTGAPFTGSRAYTLSVASPTVSITTASVPAGTVASGYSQSLSTSGGTSPYGYAVTSGSLPAGVTLSSAGLLAGTPTAGGSFNFTVTATDSSTGTGPYTAVKSYTLVINTPTIAISPSTVPVATVAATYSQTLTASGGTATYTYSISAGTLPAGVTLSSAGLLAGTPTAAGSFNFTVKAIDSSSGTGSPYNGTQAYSLTVGSPTIAVGPANLTAATIGTSTTQAITAGGGTAPYTYAVTAGALPAGVTLSSTGSLSGTPTAAGSFGFTITATDSSTGTSAPFSGAHAYSLTVNSPSISIFPSTLAAATAGVAYGQSVTASGGTSPYTYSLSAGTLPAGLTLNSSTGGITGTPTTAGSFNFTVKAIDASTGAGAPFNTTQAYTLSIGAAMVTITQTTLSAPTVGSSYSQVLTASGGTSPYSFSISSGALPAGLTLSTAGLLSGTPTAGGSFTFTVKATDATAGTGPYNGTQSYTFVTSAPSITVNPPTLTAGTIAAVYSQTITAIGGISPYGFAISSGALPVGLTLSSAGALSGTPTAAGSFNFTVQTTDASTGTGAPFNGTQAYTLVINAPTVTVSPSTLTTPVVGAAYSQTVTASSGTAPYTFSVSVGLLPVGLALNASTGAITGTPTAAGAASFTIKAVDSSTGTSAPFNGTQAYSFTVSAATIAISPSTLPAPTTGAVYSQSVSASGGTAPYTYSISSGSLPAGLTLNSSTGAITGTPTAGGAASFTIKATDSSTGTGAPFNGVQAYSVTVASATIAVTPSTLTVPTVGAAYTQSVSASGGTAPYSYSVSSGTLPAGLALNSTTGAITGTPTAGGAASFTIKATDSSTGTGAPFNGTQAYSVTISAATVVIAPTTLSSANIGSSYSQTITASGGTAPYIYSYTGTLPGGLTLSTAGVLSGTPNAGGPFSFTVKATDSSTGTGSPFTATQAYSITVGAPSLVTVTPSTLTAAAIATPYSQQMTASGGTTPYTFAVSSGSLPVGLTLTTGGLLSGTPTAGGPFSFSIKATDSSTGAGAPFSGTSSYSFTVNAPTVTVSPSTLPAPAVGTAYSQTVAGSGGTAPYTFSVSGGSLPSGLSLNATTGAITGTPTASGAASFTIMAADSSTGAGPYAGTQAYSYTAGAPTVTVMQTTVPSGTVAAAYSQTFTATGGTSPYTFAITSGALPAGVTLTSSGVLSGTPTTAGSFGFTIKATDSSTGTGAPFNGTQALTLVIGAPTVAVTQTTLTSATVGTAYTTTLTAGGGTLPYSFAVSSGTLPAGLTLSSAGVLSGTATAGGSFSFTIRATDSSTGTGAPFSGTQAFSFTVNAARVVVAPTTLTAPMAGTAYSQTVLASGGTAPYTFSVTVGSLPTGLTLNATTGTITGTPTTGTAASFTIKATDSSTGTGPYSGSQAYTLTPSAASITVQPTTGASTALTSGEVASSYSQTVSASGGTAPYTFSISTGSLPTGLTLSAATGTITGTPTAGGNFSFTIKATDSSTGTGAPFSGTQVYTLAIAAPTVSVSPLTISALIVGVSYLQSVTASGGTSPYTFAITSGSLPTGLSLSTSGAITGLPTVSGPYSFTITATDSSTGTGPFTGSRAYSVTLSAVSIVLTPSTLTAPTVAAAYLQTIAASGGVAPYTYSISTGALPAGLILNGTTGAISGTPAQGGAASFTIKATDSSTVGGPFNGTQAYSFTVAAPAVTVTTAALLSGSVSAAYSQTVTASGGTSPYTFSVSVGALPAGLTLSSVGVLSGTPTTSGSFNFTVKATDSSTGAGPYNGTQAYTLVIAAPTVVLNPTALTSATAGVAASQSVIASGGTAPYMYAATAGALPAGVTLTTAGVLSGTPTASGTFNFSITATDSTTGNGPYTATRAYSLTIVAATVTITQTTLPAPTAGIAYSQQLTASGGTAPYSFHLTSGSLPSGLTVTTGGLVSGTSTAGGSFNFTITATDSTTGNGPYSGAQGYSFTTTAPTIAVTPGTVPVATIAIAYSQSFSASGGTSAYTFTTTSTLPTGMTLSIAGVLSGTPTSAGSFSITVKATDASTGTGPYSGTTTVSLTVNAPTVAVSPSTLTAATVGVATSQTISASGGTAPYTLSLTTGTLPAGVTFNAATGVLSGTPTAGGSFSFTIKGTDSSTGTGAPFSGTQSYTFTVNVPALVLLPATLAPPTDGVSYSQSMSTTGGTAPYTYSVTGTLPTGLSLNSSTGAILGTPTAGGSFSFTIKATDSSTGTGPYNGTRAYNFTVTSATVSLAPANTLPVGIVAAAYSQTVTASGGTAPYTYTLSAGTLPSGLTLNAATGVISGTATASGSFPIAVKASDSSTGTGAPYTGTVSYTLAINAPTVTVTQTTLPAATIAAAYSQTVTASGGTAPYSFTISAGALPTGLALSSAGAITGTPTAAGSFSVTIKATDSTTGSGPYSGTQAYTFTVNAPTITLTPATLPVAADGIPYSQQLTAGAGTAPYTYTVTGALPTGITLSSTGLLSGTTTVTPAIFSITVTATDASTGTGSPFTKSTVYSFVVNPSAPIAGAVSQQVLYNSTNNVITLSFSGGSAASVAVATPASHGTATASSTSITYTPITGYTGTDSFTYTATNVTGTSAPATVSIQVGKIPVTVTLGNLAPTYNGTAQVATATTAVTSTNAPVTVSGITYTYNGSSTAPTLAGAYTVVATVVDTAYQGSATGTMNIGKAPATVSASPVSRAYGVANPATFASSTTGFLPTGFLPTDGITTSASVTATSSSAPGAYPITVAVADPNSKLSNYSVTNNGGTLTITQASTTTTFTQTTPTTAGVGTGVTTIFTAAVVDATTGSTGTPTGTVKFFDGSISIGTGTLTAGVTTVTTTFTTVATHVITAVYSSDVNFAASTSSAFNEVVVTSGFSVTANPNNLTIARGNSSMATLTFTPVGNYQGSVNLACNGLPAFTSCSFLPQTITFTGNNAVQTTQLTIYTLNVHDAPGTSKQGLLWLPAGMFALFITMRRRQLARNLRPLHMIALAAFALLSMGVLSGCGSGANFVTPTGTDTVTVIATATATAGTTSSNTTQTAVITITITQ